MERTRGTYFAAACAALCTLAITVLGSSGVEAQVVCGTYGAESRPVEQTACPGGSGGQGCSHEKLNAALVSCGGSESGSCAWTSEITPVGGCTTCTAWANACGPRICAPSVCGGGSYLEVCDGFDNDGGGQVDEGCPLPGFEGGGLTRVSQMDAATGAFVPPSRNDVEYAGATLPMSFSRVYTSLDLWPYELGSRLGAGWFHTYDERLYDGNSFGAPTSSSTTIIHRLGARGRRFTCSGGACTTNDGSLDTLAWVSAGSYFQITSGDGVTTAFYGSGANWKKGALWQKQTTRGQGWEVFYHASGALEGHIDYVQDHLGRQLDFDWSPAFQDGAPAQLVALKGASSTTLASFGYDLYARLTSASSAAGVESYDYYVDQSGRTTRLMTGITVDGQEAVSVGYDVAFNEGWVGRVATIAEASTTLRMRYRAAARNACAAPAESTMIVDRSTAPVGSSSCTDDASGDSWCENQAGMPSVCDQGLCRAIACQRYGDLVNGAGEDRITAIEGNCPCAGIATIGWTSGGSEAPRRILWEVSRDGKTTSHGYDGRGREIARCDGDTDTTVTTTATSCPNAGQWAHYEYSHTTFPLLLTREHQRSRMDAAQEAITTLTYDPNHAELTQLQFGGLTRNPANDANVSQTLATTYDYDSSGRLVKETLPAGETTSFTYHTQAGTGYGLVATAERWLNGGGTRLVTSFSDYTAVGRPGGVADPSGTSTSYGYNFGGMQLASHTRANETTSYTYDAGGRVDEVIEASGRRLARTYDARGRVLYEDVRDAQASLASNRTEYTYDAAGRRTAVIRRSLDGQGSPLAIEWQMEATYDERGSMLTTKYAGRSAIQYQLDPNGMGRTIGITREDGDQTSMSHDAFGRELEYRKYISSQTSGVHLSSYAAPSGKEGGSGLPTQITDPSSVTRDYVYDDFDRLVRAQSNDFGTIKWAYTNGQLVERRLSNGKRSTYSYDELGRVSMIDHDADSTGVVGQDYEYIYDNGALSCNISGSSCSYRKGRLATVRMEYAPGSFWDLEYDYGSHGRVTAERWPGARQTNYTWDAQGRLLRTELPVATGDKIRYEYDAVDNDDEDPSELRRVVHELTAGQDYLVWARNLRHDSLGRLTNAHFADRNDGGNPSLELTENADGSQALWRVRRRSASQDVYLMNRSYSHWPDGQVKSYGTSVSADGGRTFFWDGANRLTCAASQSGLSSCPTGSTLIESYQYDLHENRNSKVTPTGTTTY